MSFADGLLCHSRRRILLSAVFAGLSLASKPNAFFLPLVLLPWFALRFQGLSSCERKSLLRTFFCGIVIAAVVCLLLSPHLLLSFPKNLLKQFHYLLTYGGGGSADWKIIPSIHVVITTPLLMLPLLLLGLFATAANRSENRLELLLLLWFLLPILRVSLPYANDFDVIRHYLEFWPAAAIFIGIGGSVLYGFVLKLIRREASVVVAALLLSVVIAPPVFWMSQNSAHALCFYNSLISGLSGAQERNLPQATDYWGSSYRQGMAWLNENAMPHSKLFVGVAEHIVSATAPLWLRKDISHQPIAVLADELARGELARSYLMFITRKERYPEILERTLEAYETVYKIEVDGGTILQILDLSKPR